jgi:serine/threonine-protein kinase
MGIILYEMLMGRPPFAGEDDFELVEQQLEAPPPPLDPALPRELDSVIVRSLKKLPDQRFETADAMAEALQQAVLKL